MRVVTSLIAINFQDTRKRAFGGVYQLEFGTLLTCVQNAATNSKHDEFEADRSEFECIAGLDVGLVGGAVEGDGGLKRRGCKGLLQSFWLVC